MSSDELDMVPTEELVDTLSRRSRGTLVVLLPSAHEKDKTLAHRVFYSGCPYALAKLAEMVARELNVALLNVHTKEGDPT